jgi:hypothetical protein
MSKLTYNGVSIEYNSTRDVSYEDVMSEDDQDYLYTKATVMVSGLVVGGTSSQYQAGGAQANQQKTDPATNFQNVQHMLEQPRQKLELLGGGGKAILTADSNTDVKNGPFPKVVSINRIDGQEAIQVSFQVVTYRYECPNNSASRRPNFISNRYRETASRDNQWLETRTRTGKVVILGGKEFKAIDTLRANVTPPIPAGWERKTAEYLVQEDGLAMTYTIVDKETIQTAPSPAIEADGSFTDTHPHPGALRWGTATIRLKGTKETPTNDMVLTAVSLVYERMRQAGGIQGVGEAKSFAAELTTRHAYMTNTVDVSVRAMLRNYGTQLSKNTPDARNFAHFKRQPWPNVEPSPVFKTDSGVPLQTAKPENKLCSSSPPKPAEPTQTPAKPTTVKQPAQPPQQTTVGQLPLNQSQPILSAAQGVIAGTAGGDYNGTGEFLQQQGYDNDSSPLAMELRRQLGISAPGSLVNSQTYSVTTAPDITVDESVYVQGGIYNYYEIRPRFVFNEGLAELPAMSADGDIAMVRLHQRTCRLVVEWAAERIGEAPVIPTGEPPANAAGGPVKFASEIMPGMMERIPGGAYSYRVAGSYTWSFRRPNDVVVQAAVAPWSRDLETAAVAIGGGLAGFATATFIDSMAAKAVTNTSDRVHSVGTAPTGAVTAPASGA